MVCLSESPLEHLRWLLSHRQWPPWGLLVRQQAMYDSAADPSGSPAPSNSRHWSRSRRHAAPTSTYLDLSDSEARTYSFGVQHQSLGEITSVETRKSIAASTASRPSQPSEPQHPEPSTHCSCTDLRDPVPRWICSLRVAWAICAEACVDAKSQVRRTPQGRRYLTVGATVMMPLMCTHD